MEKSRVFRCLTFLTFMLMLLCILTEVSFAAKDSLENGTGNQDKYVREEVRNSSKNETDDTSGADGFVIDKERLQNNSGVEDQNKISDHKREKNQLKEELQIHKQEYKEAKGEFLKIRNLVRAGKLDPNSEEALNATKFYLNSSVDYMIAHLSNVKSNLAYSNGNGTEEKIIDIDEKIKLLEAEKANVTIASNQGELAVVVRSVRGVWNNAEKASLEGAGKTVSEKIGVSLEKSENISVKLGAKVGDLNKTGVNTSDLDTKLANYSFFINSAKQNKEAADAIYSDENVTSEDMQKANNYLRQSLSDINKANDIIKHILNELKKYKTEKGNETGVENTQKTAFNNTENITGTNSLNSTTGNPESIENASFKKEKSHISGDDTGNLTEELHN